MYHAGMADGREPCPVNHNHAATVIPQDAMRREDVPSGTLDSMRCGARLWNCPRCGRFMLSIIDQDWLVTDPKICFEGKNEERERWINNQSKLEHLLSERTSQRLPVPWLQLQRQRYWPVYFDPPIAVAQIHVEDFLSGWPDSFAERLDRALLNLARATHNDPGSAYRSSDIRRDERLANMLFSHPRQEFEVQYVLTALEDRRHIKVSPESNPNDVSSCSPASLLITPAGWERIEELNRGRTSPENPAFVAMWFGNDEKDETPAFMDDVFKVVERAALRAGYRAARVDTEPHTEAEDDFIMNKALGMIRAAPFVIADLTGNRNGVYFEAGFARGLGIRVIQTCRESHFGEAHFDVKQIDTKRWTDPKDLDEQIYHEIMATIGQGPHSPDEGEQ